MVKITTTTGVTAEEATGEGSLDASVVLLRYCTDGHIPHDLTVTPHALSILYK